MKIQKNIPYNFSLGKVFLKQDTKSIKHKGKELSVVGIPSWSSG